MSNEIEQSIDDSTIVESILSLSEPDFKILAEASIIFLNDKDKLERLNTLNYSLLQVADSKEISKWLLKIFSTCLRQNVEPGKIVKYFQSRFNLNEGKLNTIKELWEKHWSGLKETLDNQSLMISQLVDMEWKFGVTASTNQIEKLGNAFLQLKLVYNKGGKLETSFMEMSLPQFYSFLHEMNKAKSQMDYLS